MKMKKIFVSILLLGILILVIWLVFFSFKPTTYVANQRPHTDLERLKTEKYDSVFLSMFPIQHYEEADYAHFWARDLVKANLCIPNLKIYDRYEKTAFAPEHQISIAYLGVDPTRLPLSKVTDLLKAQPDTTFDILLPYPQLRYWTTLDKNNCEKILKSYQDYATTLLTYENARVYLFAGVEWLVANPGNYNSLFNTNPEISRTLLCNTDDFHGYMLTEENLEDSFLNLQQMVKAYREQANTYSDASDWDIVFLGDSFFGNYTDSASIPGVVQGLTGARTFNCGYSGEGAALSVQTTVSLSDIADALASHSSENLPADTLLHKGVTAFLQRNPGEHTMFVINYGLNDYFQGVPVATEDTYDEASYEGALRQGILTLKEAYPDAFIVLNTPTFTVYYENGTERRSDVGGLLVDYVEAARKVGKELDVTVLDTYSLLPTTAENWSDFLSDGCHPNESTRFLLGSLLAELMPAN